MTGFSKIEAEFLESREDARIATSHGDIPHVKPVSFVLYEGAILVATDYDTRTFSNVRSNPNVAITVDVYRHGGHKAVCVQGRAEIVEEGGAFRRFYDVFYEKFEWVRRDPWKEGEAPFLSMVPGKIVSWGLD